MCNGEGEYVCQNSQCRCQCAEEFPQCNCPFTDIQIMEFTLANMAKSWAEAYKDLENSGTCLTYYCCTNGPEPRLEKATL